jgi:hypothetical protein
MHSFYTTVINFIFNGDPKLEWVSRWKHCHTPTLYRTYTLRQLHTLDHLPNLLRYLRPPPMIRIVWPKIFLITFHWIRSPCSPKRWTRTPRVSSDTGGYVKNHSIIAILFLQPRSWVKETSSWATLYMSINLYPTSVFKVVYFSKDYSHLSLHM